MSQSYLYESSDNDEDMEKISKEDNTISMEKTSKEDNTISIEKTSKEDNTISMEKTNGIIFKNLRVSVKKEIIRRLNLFVTIYKLKVQVDIPAEEQINLKHCQKYAKNFTQYKSLSAKLNATIVFSSYLIKHDLKIDECIYFTDENIKKYHLKHFKTEGRHKNDPNVSLNIRNTFFEKHPTMKQYESDINQFYDRNVTKTVKTSDIIRWCTSACVVAYSKGVIIDINNEFSDIKRYLNITREIYHHGFNCPIDEHLRTYWTGYFIKHKPKS